MFLELVSIIFNCIFFPSLLLLYRLFHTSLCRVCKLGGQFFLYFRRKGLWDTNISFPFVKVGQE